MGATLQTEVSGQVIEVAVSNGGQFSAQVGGQYIHSSTLEELRTRARSAVTKTKVKLHIQYVTIAGGNLVRGEARGKHAKSGEILVTEAGQKVTKRAYSVVIHPVDDTELAEGQHLLDEYNAASRAWSAWRSAREFNLGSSVTTALKNAVEG